VPLSSEERGRRNPSTRRLGGSQSRFGRFGKAKENVVHCRKSKCEFSFVQLVLVSLENPGPEIRSSGRLIVASARPDLRLECTDLVTRLLFAVSYSKYRYASLNDGDTF